MISMSDIFAAARSIKPDEGGTTEPYAMAIIGADVVFGVYPDSSGQGVGLAIIRGEYDCEVVPERWSAVFCAGADHAQALADTFGSVREGGLTLAEASHRLNELMAKSARDTRRRRQKMN